MGLLDKMEKKRNVAIVVSAGKETQAQQQQEQSVPELAKVEESVTDQFKEEKERLQAEAITVLNANHFNESTGDRQEVVKRVLSDIIANGAYDIPRANRPAVIKEVCSELIGFGPLDALLENEAISEIMVNGPKDIYVEMKGKLMLTKAKFRDDAHVMTILDRIVSPIGRHIDEASPMVDARLPDGSRVNAVIPPLALSGPTITIRKFARNPIKSADLIRFGSLDNRMITFLEACVKARLNIVVSGGTGSGKTTLLGVLSAYIPENERIVTIEDAAELQLQQRHVVRLESRPANAEGRGKIAIQDLLVNALRMRPDRIVVGECRGGEALDMLQAMNTGHDGSLTTGHANSPRDMVSRLETMVLMSGMELPDRAIREQITAAIDIIVQQTRLNDGTRKVVAITEVVGMEGDVVTLQNIFEFKQEGVDATGKVKGAFVSTGVRPMFLDKFAAAGIPIRNDWFEGGEER